MASGTWPVFGNALSQALCCLWVSERHLCWAKYDSSWLTQLRAMETWPCLSLCQSTQVRTNGLEIFPYFVCYPQSCSTWILRSKNRPIYVVSSSLWAKVKGFALTASENTGLAWELTELSYYTAPVFQPQLLLILFYETF